MAPPNGTLTERDPALRVDELQLLMNPPDDTDANLHSFVEGFANENFGKQCHSFQSKSGSYLLDFSQNQEQSKTLFLIRPPGDGKSLTYILVGGMLRAITLIFQPTLALSADQFSKLEAMAKVTKGMRVMNLDDYDTPATWSPKVELLNALLDGPWENTCAIFLIVSPQSASSTTRPWQDLFYKLAAKGLIRLLVLDEYHLVRAQGLSFRPEFPAMGKVIAKIREESPYTRLIALTATSTLPDIAIVEHICNLRASRITWATPKEAY